MTEVSPALLVLYCLLNHHLLLQQGPQGKGVVDDLMVEVLAVEASVCSCLGHCSGPVWQHIAAD